MTWQDWWCWLSLGVFVAGGFMFSAGMLADVVKRTGAEKRLVIPGGLVALAGVLSFAACKIGTSLVWT